MIRGGGGGLLHVDVPTLAALQVFASERHPSAMGLGKPKEGFSLFGLANRCVTQMGRKLLRLWFLRPVVNLEVLRDRQDTIEVLLRNGGELIGALRAELKKLPDIPSLLLRAAHSQQRPDSRVLGQLQACLQQLLRLRAVFETQLAPGLAEAMRGREGEGGPGQSALDLLLNMLDARQSEEGSLVAAGVCPELDRLKAAYRALPDYLTRVVESELQRVPRCLVRHNSSQLWSVLYLPQVGFVMRVQGQQLTADLLDALPDYELAFEGAAGPEEVGNCGAAAGAYGGEAGASGGGWAAYYRTDATRELNARFGDMQYKIQDLEASLVAEMVSRLLAAHGARLARAAAVAAELDCLLSLAAMAADGGGGAAPPYCRPQLTSDNVLSIVNGRHPLAETVVPAYIPFSTAMRGDGARLQVVTGPNASGKSCYARAVALIVFMAHLGAYVPAEAAVVGLVDRIAARAAAPPGAVWGSGGGVGGGAWEGGGRKGSDGCGGAGLRPSTFLADLAQVSAMLVSATSRSLLILDEFGKEVIAALQGGRPVGRSPAVLRSEGVRRDLQCLARLKAASELAAGPAQDGALLELLQSEAGQPSAAEGRVDSLQAGAAVSKLYGVA
ncbi:hypothetical protein GPECTOR_14g90 [Gonium pectorale]|uniref:DNA mismatch repair proteins mutS family domain-containing protein n=1 Tax=Gonium pectorale TaxID=33097 RepID=A0A150GMQ7_GONPE|nr:hypothetical protein GPECTOR_14g90 [Gonium pectorale]|eukprot:KXZ51109.1 hypothetical protein GPECTOR_14g90 [Gonium pectorale]